MGRGGGIFQQCHGGGGDFFPRIREGGGFFSPIDFAEPPPPHPGHK